MTGTSDLIERLRARGARRVALQFPEGLKRRSFSIASDLRAAGFSVMIDGDPCYGACDLALDTLAYADVLVHFGHTPLASREDVIYEPFVMDFDLEVLTRVLPLLSGKCIGLVTTAQHAHMVPAMQQFLENRGIGCRVSPGNGRTPLPGQVLGCSYEAAREAGSDEILFVGTGEFHPLGVALSTGARVIALDPYTGIARQIDASRLLRKRFAIIEKAKKASHFGIITSTKSGQVRRELAERLSTLHRHAIVITMREVIPDELINLGFPAYVNTACPRLAFDDQIRFPVPVITPQEFEIVCGVRSWDDYAIDEIP
ncbi:MAG: diphthamide biosynthesis enzyme Dph2 [Methanoregulaceae archaeon]|nr:diphthamide biosynthesis enzyme Dph2 [Methanoregulaceae archaeon]